MEQVFKWLAILGRLSNLYADQQFRELNINSSHHVFLLHICNNPGITQDKLKTMVYIHPSNITRALDYLEKEGYIKKEILITDKRTSQIYPTEKAQKAYYDIIRVISDWEGLITKDMEEKEKEEFSVLLEKAGITATKYFFEQK